MKDPHYDGSDAYLDYTVTLVVKNEQAGPLTLADSMTLPTGVTAEYVEDSLQLSMENGNTTLRITWENDNGERKITLVLPVPHCRRHLFYPLHRQAEGRWRNGC